MVCDGGPLIVTSPLPYPQVALWGRSMGAVAAILYSHSPDYIAHPPVALVLDSPFASFPRLVDDLIKKVCSRSSRTFVRRTA